MTDDRKLRRRLTVWYISLSGARFNHHLRRTVTLVHDGATLSAAVTSLGRGQYSVTIGDK